MWPWEHLAFGYFLYSMYTRIRFGQSPTDAPVFALIVATQLPDLVDKPLSWTLAILPTARSLAHSVFVAALVIGLVGVIARNRGVPEIGEAVAVGYGSHLLGDVLYGVLRGGSPDIAFLFWPLVDQPVRSTPGAIARFRELLIEFVGYLQSPAGTGYLVFELGMLIGLLVLWISDGCPGLWLRKPSRPRT